MVKSDIYRPNKGRGAYNKHLSEIDNECSLCVLRDNKTIESTKKMLVINNIFPYDFWDSLRVKDHLMVVSKRHVERLSDMDNSERSEWFELISKYQNKDYLIYTRFPKGASSTLTHTHTHLIKPIAPKIKYFLFIESLRIRWFR